MTKQRRLRHLREPTLTEAHRLPLEMQSLNLNMLLADSRQALEPHRGERRAFD